MEASERHFFHSKSPFISLSVSLSLSLSPSSQAVKGSARGKRAWKGGERAVECRGGGVEGALMSTL